MSIDLTPPNGRTEPLDVAPRMALLFNGLAIGAVTLATLLPVASTAYWLLADPGEVRQMAGLSLELLPDITMGQRLAAALVALLTCVPLAWGFARLRTCLASFASGRPFSAQGIAGLRDFALGGMLAALAQLVGHTAMGLVLTWNAAPGHRQLVLRVDSDMLLLAMFAGTIAALAWAMEKAAALAEENSQFI